MVKAEKNKNQKQKKQLNCILNQLQANFDCLGWRKKKANIGAQIKTKIEATKNQLGEIA